MAFDGKAGAREFVVDTAVVAATQLLLKLRGLVTLPLIVKLLGTTAYGIWAQMIAFTTFTAGLLSLNLHLPLIRFISGDRSRSASVYSTLLVATLAVTGAGAGVVWLASDSLGTTLMGIGDTGRYLGLAALIIMFANLRLLDLNVYRATGRLRLRSAIELVASVGELAGIVVLIRAGYGLYAVFVFMAAWNGVLATFQTIHCLAITGWSAPNAQVLRDALRYSLPLIPASLSVWALDRIDRFVIGGFLGAEAVGIYSANYALASVLMLAQAPFQMTLFPKVASLWDADRPLAARYISVSNKVFLTFSIPFVVVVPMVARPALILLGNHQVAEAAGINTLLIAAGVMLWGISIMQIQIFYGARRTYVVGAVTAAAAVINLAVNLVLVPTMGVAGAAAATLVAYAATCVAFAWLARGIIRIDWDPAHLGACVLAAGGSAGLVYWIAPVDGATLALALAAAAGSYVLLLLLFRKILAATIGVGGFDLGAVVGRRPR